MACFLVPAAEAIITTVATKTMKNGKSATATKTPATTKAPFLKKLKWLSNLLWGGSALLAFEHVWHGEITPVFPFLTAANNAADAAEMLHEMATSGIAMAALVTAVWAGMVLVSNRIEKRTPSTEPTIN